jgi:hypothetical protein
MTLALKSWIVAGALGRGAVAFSAPAEARGFGGFRGGISGFHGGGIMGGLATSVARLLLRILAFFVPRFLCTVPSSVASSSSAVTVSWGRSQSVLRAPLTTLWPTTLPMQYPRMIKA